MSKESLSMHISEKGEVTFDVNSGDAGCKGVTEKVLAQVQASGLDLSIINTEYRYPDGDDGKIKIHC